MRPHDFSIERQRDGEASIEAVVRHVNSAGSRAKVELEARGTRQVINAELTKERYAELGLKSGDTVYATARRAKVFVPNYAI